MPRDIITEHFGKDVSVSMGQKTYARIQRINGFPRPQNPVNGQKDAVHAVIIIRNLPTITTVIIPKIVDLVTHVVLIHVGAKNGRIPMSHIAIPLIHVVTVINALILILVIHIIHVGTVRDAAVTHWVT
jgi:hypothetical protein